MTDVNNVIAHPGKFEGEREAVRYAYNQYLDGFYDDDDGEVVTVTLSTGEVVRWSEDVFGFINEVKDSP